MNINPFVNDNIIQHRNMTASQKKNINNTREGVVVNSYVKDNNENLSEMKDTFLISDNETMPKQLYNDNKIVEKKLLPLSSIALGVMGSIAAITGFVRYSAKVSKNVSKEKWLPAVTRNVNLNEELHQVIYQMVQSPNSKTFIAGAGVLTLSAMAFMGKTFFDGFKEIWVKRKESDIQKNLQENLVNVETQAFAGKMQIIRSMLSKYTKDFEKYLNTDDKSSPEFGRKTFEQFAFGGVHDKNNDNPENKKLLHYLHDGDTLELQDFYVRVMHDYQSKIGGDAANDGSLMLQFKVAEDNDISNLTITHFNGQEAEHVPTPSHGSFLVCGDIGESQSQYIMDEYQSGLHSYILQVSHHGNGGPFTQHHARQRQQLAMGWLSGPRPDRERHSNRNRPRDDRRQPGGGILCHAYPARAHLRIYRGRALA